MNLFCIVNNCSLKMDGHVCRILTGRMKYVAGEHLPGAGRGAADLSTCKRSRLLTSPANQESSQLH